MRLCRILKVARHGTMPKPSKPIPFSWENLKKLIHYDPDTGQLTRAVDIINNRIKAGDDACTIRVSSSNNLPYKRIYLEGKEYSAHRIAWFLHYRIDPYTYGKDKVIDHINQDSLDNRIINLRIITTAENNQNKGEYKKNA
tara:strand:- start:574 stop:996 length:423 start_codon:yes stop_codon:yes gene_type:complete